MILDKCHVEHNLLEVAHYNVEKVRLLTITWRDMSDLGDHNFTFAIPSNIIGLDHKKILETL